MLLIRMNNFSRFLFVYYLMFLRFFPGYPHILFAEWNATEMKLQIDNMKVKLVTENEKCIAEYQHFFSYAKF